MTTGVTVAFSVTFPVRARYSSEHSRNCAAGSDAGTGIPLGWSGRGGAGWGALAAVGAGGDPGGSVSAVAGAPGVAASMSVAVGEGVGAAGAPEAVDDALAEAVGEDSPADWGTGSPLVHDASISAAAHQAAAWT